MEENWEAEHNFIPMQTSSWWSCDGPRIWSTNSLRFFLSASTPGKIGKEVIPQSLSCNQPIPVHAATCEPVRRETKSHKATAEKQLVSVAVGVSTSASWCFLVPEGLFRALLRVWACSACTNSTFPARPGVLASSAWLLQNAHPAGNTEAKTTKKAEKRNCSWHCWEGLQSGGQERKQRKRCCVTRCKDVESLKSCPSHELPTYSTRNGKEQRNNQTG